MTTSLPWKEKFAGLPNIPLTKKWLYDGRPKTATLEQIISNKLLASQPITPREGNLLLDCIFYYNKLLKALKTFNFSNLSTESIQDLLQYIEYAFNYLPALSNQIELYKTFRLVENNDGKSKEFKHQLSYPPMDIVREKNVLNRANSPRSTVFYSSESIDVAFKELRPKPNSLVTLGIWEPINNASFLSYPIMGNQSAHELNANARSAANAFNVLKQKANPLLGKFLDGYFNVLNNEYTKKVEHKNEYLISAFFSERIFKVQEDEWNFDCIVYPSVSNEFAGCNFAFKPETINSRLKLVSAVEMDVQETYYDQFLSNTNPDLLTIAQTRINKKSKFITENGGIFWE